MPRQSTNHLWRKTQAKGTQLQKRREAAEKNEQSTFSPISDFDDFDTGKLEDRDSGKPTDRNQTTTV